MNNPYVTVKAVRLVRHLGPHRSAILTLLSDYEYMREVREKVAVLSREMGMTGLVLQSA